MRALVAALCFALNTAHAAVVTVNFESETAGYRFDNFTIAGLQFSPRCPVAIRNVNAYETGPSNLYLSVDPENNCGTSGDNDNYLGTVIADIWIGGVDALFDFLGVDSLVPIYHMMTFEVLSSKGGYFKHAGETGPFTFSGAEWTDVAWIALRDIGNDGFHNRHGWDNFVFDVHPMPAQVSEPAALLLLLALIVGLLFKQGVPVHITREGRLSRSCV